MHCEVTAESRSFKDYTYTQWTHRKLTTLTHIWLIISRPSSLCVSSGDFLDLLDKKKPKRDIVYISVRFEKAVTEKAVFLQKKLPR